MEKIKHNLDFKARRKSMHNPKMQLLGEQNKKNQNSSSLLTKKSVMENIKNDPRQSKRQMVQTAKAKICSQRLGKDNSVVTFASLTSPMGFSSNPLTHVNKETGKRETPRARRAAKRRARSSNNFNEDDFDFAVVLSPSADYSMWASELDFRGEGELFFIFLLP